MIEAGKVVVGKEVLLGLFCCKSCKELGVSSLDLEVGILGNNMVCCSISDKTEVGSKLSVVVCTVIVAVYMSQLVVCKLVVGMQVVCTLGN